MEQGPWHPVTYVDWWPISEDHRALNSMPCLGKVYEFWTFSITALGSRGYLTNSQGCIFPAGIALEFVSQVEYWNIGQCVFRTLQSVRLRCTFMLHTYGRKLLPRGISGGRQDWKVAVFHGEGQLFLVILVAVLLWKAWCESSFLPLQVFLAALSFSCCIPHSCPLVQFGHMECFWNHNSLSQIGCQGSPLLLRSHRGSPFPQLSLLVPALAPPQDCSLSCPRTLPLEAKVLRVQSADQRPAGPGDFLLCQAWPQT